MPDFDHTHYVPVLKGKEGEYLALRELTDSVKDRLTPLIEIPSIPYDFINETVAKTVDQHLARVIEKIGTCWGADRDLFMDLDLIPPDEVMSDGSQPLKFIFDSARAVGLRLIPVTGVNRASDYQDAVREAKDNDGRGVCIRIESDDLVDFADLATKLTDLLGDLDLTTFDADLIIDLEAISPLNPTGPILLAANSIIANLPLVRDWRTLTLAATAFPQDLSNLSPRTATLIPRTEWIVWQTLAARRERILRLPTFGDYAIAHPVPNEIDPRLLKMSAQLRYTTDNDWLIFKERNVRDYGYEQFNEICRTLISRPEYKGAAFSWGDNAINVCAGPGSNPGNATTWRRIGTNHHLTFAVDQIANLPGL